MKKVLADLKDKSGSVLLNNEYRQNDMDSIPHVALKQHVRAVFYTRQPRSFPWGDSCTLHLRLVGN